MAWSFQPGKRLIFPLPSFDKASIISYNQFATNSQPTTPFPSLTVRTFYYLSIFRNFDLHGTAPVGYGVLERLLERIFKHVIDRREGSTFQFETEIETPEEVLKKLMKEMLAQNREWDADLTVTELNGEGEAHGNTQLFRIQKNIDFRYEDNG